MSRTRSIPTENVTPSTSADAPLDRLLKVDEVVLRLQQPRSSVYTLIRTGKLTAINLAPGKGRVLRVRESDLRAFIESRKSRA